MTRTTAIHGYLMDPVAVRVGRVKKIHWQLYTKDYRLVATFETRELALEYAARNPR